MPVLPAFLGLAFALSLGRARRWHGGGDFAQMRPPAKTWCRDKWNREEGPSDGLPVAVASHISPYVALEGNDPWGECSGDFDCAAMPRLRNPAADLGSKSVMSRVVVRL